VFSYDAIADAQAQPGSLAGLFGGEKQFKYLAYIVLFNA
jgi:hypothetical protein